MIDETTPGASLLSAEEWLVYSALSDAWNLFVKLEHLHVADQPEFAAHINAAKNIVLARPVARELQRQHIGGYNTTSDHELSKH